ncbi:hypothetical protein PRUPE_8G212000 [Prunus persica]|uniref:Uncharacterized protein n=1 Tax=Prunus persica TaxID=3760 RepID=A0A251N169_PRUPE|nr:hypothetical protein PRUPE_8G212000 [Prunus persica]
MARKSSKVEALYELCQNMFTPSGSPPPSSAAINKLFLFWAQCLRLMLGLKRKIWMMIETMDIFGLDQLNRVARWAQPITYLDIYMNVIVLRQAFSKEEEYFYSKLYHLLCSQIRTLFLFSFEFLIYSIWYCKEQKKMDPSMNF